MANEVDFGGRTLKNATLDSSVAGGGAPATIDGGNAASAGTGATIDGGNA